LGEFFDTLGSLQQEHAIPTMRCHGDAAVISKGPDVIGMKRFGL
jgi:hypothetical protein